MPIESGIESGVRAAGGIINILQAPERMAMERRKLALEGRQTAVSERAVGVQERQADMAEETPEARYNKNLGASPVRMKTYLTQLINKVPETKMALQPFTDELVDGQYKTRQEAIQGLMALQNDPSFKEMRQNLVEAAARARSKGDTKKAAMLEGVYDETSPKNYERTVDTLTGKPQSMWRTASDMGANIKDAERWSDPYKDEYGNFVRRNLDTNKVEKVTGAPTGWSVEVGPDGTVRMTQGPKDKNLPASEVDKMAALKTSGENLDQMLAILDENPNSDITGVWEAANRYIDNWNIAGKQDRNRAEFRQRVALALKFMYDVMGRQLAVQEMKKGAPMLPEMGVDEKVNRDRIVNLKGYMDAMARAKKDLFNQYGYKVPEGPLDVTNPGVKKAIESRAAVIVDELRAQGVTDPEELNRLATKQVTQEFFGE